MHIIDIIIVIAYLIICILIGLYRYKSVKTLKEYALGIGHFPSIVIVTTTVATVLGAQQVIGYVAEIYTLGMFFMIACLFTPMTSLVMAAIYSRSIEQFRGCISLSDIMEVLYGKVGRWVANITSVFYSIGIMLIQISAMGYLMHYFFGISYSHSAIIVTSVLCIYSMFGGIRAVALTDVFQLTILMVALPIAFSFLYNDIGGYRSIVNALPSSMMTLDINIDNVFLFVSLIFYALLPNTDGVIIQRCLMCRDSIQLRYCMNMIAAITLILPLILYIIALILKIKVQNMDSNVVFIHFIIHHIAVGFKGLIIAGLLAVAMSTADSHINYTSVLCTHDILRKLVKLTEKQALLAARMFVLFVCFICILSIFLINNTKRLLEVEFFIQNFTMPLMIVPLIAGFLKFRTNSKSFISSTVLAIFFTSMSGFIVGELDTISLMCGMIGSAVGLFGMHYWQVYQGVLNINNQFVKFGSIP